MTSGELKFSRHEAALITGVSVVEVDKAYDEGWFDRPKRRHIRGGTSRSFSPADLVHFRLLKHALEDAVIRDESKRQLHRSIQNRVPDILLRTKSGGTAIELKFEERASAPAHLAVSAGEIRPEDRAPDVIVVATKDPPGPVLRTCFARIKSSLAEPVKLHWISLDAGSAWAEISDRLADVTAARLSIVSDPEIRGGEPVVLGTRIPAHMLGDLSEQGASAKELLEDYPALDAERLRLALIYAKTHPRTGRPKKRPWAERT
jgi:uncharacterized protein (DUF433 family)